MKECLRPFYFPEKDLQAGIVVLINSAIPIFKIYAQCKKSDVYD